MSMEKLLRRHRLTIRAKFVPLSRAAELRGGDPNAGGWPMGSRDNPTLNFRVTLLQSGRPFAEVPWTAGCAYCKTYNGKVTQEVRNECERGTKYRPTAGLIFHNVAADAREVLLNRGFKEWAESLCFDSDSIEARHSYDACVRNAVALVATIGYEDVMRMANDEDYQ